LAAERPYSPLIRIRLAPLPAVPPAAVPTFHAARARGGRTEALPRVPRVALAFALGALAVGVAAQPFELERFFVPKEVALELAAAAAFVLAVRGGGGGGTAKGGDAPADALGGIGGTGVDLALAGFLLASLASTAVAPSAWLAVRALGVSAAGVARFWAARAAARAGSAEAVLRAAAVPPVVAVATALAQAYGAESEYFSVNRAPGGTFGNRNFVAHLCAVGLPVPAYLALRPGARRVRRR